MSKMINVLMLLDGMEYEEAVEKTAAFYGLSVDDAKQIIASEVDAWMMAK